MAGSKFAAAALATLLAGTGVASAAPMTPAGPPTNTADRTVVRNPSPMPKLTDIRTGEHARFDRVVFDLNGAPPGYAIGYVKRVHADPSDKVVRLAGDANLMIRLKPAKAHRDDGTLTYPGPDRFAPRYANLRQVALVGDFEGVVSVALGLRHRAGFRVMTLRHPTRIVVDVAH